MRARLFLILMVFACLLSGLVASSTAGFAQKKAEEMCANPQVEKVFICSGEMVKVVWADKDKGYTFFKPDGTVVDCKTLEYGKATAQCLQLAPQNLCPNEIKCVREEQPKNESETTQQPETQQLAVNESKKTETKNETTVQPKKENNTIVIPFEKREQKEETKEDFLLPVAAAFGAMIVVLLLVYYIFKRTVRPN